jgi:molecular chaperone DnaK
MARATIDFGIDLGTTNSEIALMEEGWARVFRNPVQGENTPSVVRISRGGEIQVGSRAYERLVDDPENTYGEFKRLMGKSHKCRFAASGRQLAPEELSAEVLKALRADVVRAGFECHAAAITVPAYFEIVQCDATQRATKLAGLLEAPLLQEPIAAAIAYGKDAPPRDGYWLIYDLGGGTFDVAVIKRTKGHLSIVDCGGDNFRGGKEFDWLLVEQILIPALTSAFDLPGLSRSNKTYLRLLAKLKAEAESSKIALTDQETVSVELFNCGVDRRGIPIELTVPIRRVDYERLIAPSVAETLRLCHETLARARLSTQAIERIILVGGPTMTPAIRTALRDGLGVPLDTRVDPITVVARGAAIFASSQPFPQAHQTRTAGRILVELSFSALCQEPTTMIAGRLQSAGQQSLPPRLRIRISRDDRGWESAFIPVEEGTFVSQCALREHQSNTFRLALYDATGKTLPSEPESLCITHGLSVANPPLQRTIGVEILTAEGGGRFVPLIERGTPLPAKGTRTFRAARTLKPGDATDALNIHVLEGEHDNPEQNRHLGTLLISGTRIRRAILADAEIQVTLSVDVSRIPTAQAFIPLLDDTIEEVIENVLGDQADPKDLTRELQSIEAKWSAAQQSDPPSPEVTTRIEEHMTQATVELAAAHGGDPGALAKAERHIQELQALLVNASKVLEITANLTDMTQAQNETRRVAQQHGNPQDRVELQALEADADRARERRDPRLCTDTTERLWRLYWNILFRQDGFWVGVFQDLAERGRFTDPTRANALLAEGSRLLQTHDMEKFRQVTWQLWSLVPQEAQRAAAKRVSDAGIKS